MSGIAKQYRHAYFLGMWGRYNGNWDDTILTLSAWQRGYDDAFTPLIYKVFGTGRTIRLWW